MFTFENSIFIDRSPQEVFDFMSNPANAAQWNNAVESAEWASEGPPGVGSVQRSKVRFLGRKLDVTSQVTIWDPQNQYGFKIDKPAPYEFTMNLESNENGTQLTGTFHGEFGGLFKLAEGLVGKQAEKDIITNFDNLKNVLEAGQV